jgi:hypothetical protein
MFVQALGPRNTGVTAAKWPMSTTGPLIQEDANCVSHVYFNGTGLVDTKNNPWVMSGTVPQVSVTPFLPSGGNGALRHGAGPFSAANYYILSAPTLSFGTGSVMTVVAVYDPTASDITTQSVLCGVGFYNGSTENGGWIFQVASGFNTVLSGTAAGGIGSNAFSGAPNVFCGGYDGANNWGQENFGAVSTVASNGFGRQLTNFCIGKLPDYSGTFIFGGILYELYITTTVPSAALFAKIQAQILGQVSAWGGGRSVTCLRSP